MSAAETYQACSIKRDRRTRADIDAVKDAIVAILNADHPMTVRQVFYQLVVRGAIEKTEEQYQGTVIRLLTDLRVSGRVPFGWIVDESRRRIVNRTYNNIADAARNTAECYRRNAMHTCPDYVEVWSEKEALAGVIRSAAPSEIDASMIYSIVDELRRHGIPGTKPKNGGSSDARGRAMAGALGKLFAWAVQHRRISNNTTLGMFRPKSPPSRDRVLGKQEIRQFWKACDEIGWPFGPCLQLLLLTGARRSEVADMQWAELNEDFSVWSLPSSRTKNKLPHTLFLPPMARAIIAATPRMAGAAHVFTTNGSTPISGFSKIKRRLDALTPSGDWRVHDLRRTAVTTMAEIGVAPHIVEAVVNHVSGYKGEASRASTIALLTPRRRRQPSSSGRHTSPPSCRASQPRWSRSGGGGYEGAVTIAVRTDRSSDRRADAEHPREHEAERSRTWRPAYRHHSFYPVHCRVRATTTGAAS